MATVLAPSPRRQVAALTRTFIARFFENELSAGTNDLRGAFYWMVAVLAPLGLVMPWVMVFSYTGIFYAGGHDLLRLMTQADKTLYLGYAMVSSGAVAVVVWNSLLIDRRDALVLGVLPVRGYTMVTAKLAALFGYIGLIAVCTHAAAAVSFGFVLGNWGGIPFVFRSIFVHFVVSCLASAFVVLAIAGLQGLLLTVVGPRIFARLSPLLQLALAALVLTSLFMLPVVAGSVVDTLGLRPHDFDLGRTGFNRPWIVQTPAIWFLGLYEYMLGDPMVAVMPGFASRALAATGIAATVTLVTFPLAYLRLMRAAVEGVGTTRVAGSGLGASERLARIASRSPGVRAAMQFFLASLARVERHRFVLAITGGLACVLALPALLSTTASLGVATSTSKTMLRQVELLSAPIAMMTIVIVGLRVAASLPSDPKAGWMFALLDPLAAPTRTAVARVCWIFGVAPPIVIFAPFLWQVFGPAAMAWHSVLTIAIGAVVIETLLQTFAAVPCTVAWRPESLKLRNFWPLYLAAFLGVTRVVPVFGWMFRGRPLPMALLCFAFSILAIALHLRARSIERATYPETDVTTPVQVLNLTG